MKLDLLYVTNKDGDKSYVMNVENIARILRSHDEFAGRFRFESFKNRMQMKVKDNWVDMNDNLAIVLMSRISVLFPFLLRVNKKMVSEAVNLACYENTYDSAIEYIKSIKWDNTPRLDTWLTSVYGVEDNEYHRAVGSNWMKGLVHRIIEPGCKFDYVLVLEGTQGLKKSTSFSKLCTPSWHLETTRTPDNKDFFSDMSGKLVVEFSEGESLSRSDIKKLKAVITTANDTYRPPYAMYSMDFPRRCVFAMTTNQNEYLKDETGNRRWLPVRCEKEADIRWIEENRDQLFAEAHHRITTLKETTWEFPVEETKRQQEDRRVEDPNTEMIVDWYLHTCSRLDKINGLTIHQVYMQAFQSNSSFANKGMTKAIQMSVADVLKRTLKLEKRQVMEGGIRTVRWYEKGLQSDIDTILQSPIVIKELNEF